MNTKKLRQKILDLAIHGKLVAQNPNDEPASELLKRINPKAEIISNSDEYRNLPFDIPKNWCWTTLGEIGKWQSGSTPSRLNKDYYNGNIPWLKTGDLNDGYITHIPEYITEKALNETSVKLNPAGSVLIAMYGATIGKIGILTFPATTNQACCACEVFNVVEKEFLFFFLLSHREEFIKMGGGGAQPNISKEKIINTFIPLPPLEEQKRIVEAIDKWFALIDSIENNKADLETIIKQTKSKILDLAIHGKLVAQNPNDEPASELLKRINPKAEIISNSEQYENLPNGWCITLYKNIVKNVNSKAYQILQSEIKVNGKYPVISQSSNYIEGYSNCTEKVFQCKEAIIFGDHTRNVKFINFPFIVGADGVKILQTQFDYKYIYYFTIFSSDNLIEDKGYSRHFGQLSSLEIPLPPLAEQKRIVVAIDKAFKYLDAIAESL